MLHGKLPAVAEPGTEFGEFVVLDTLATVGSSVHFLWMRGAMGMEGLQCCLLGGGERVLVAG